MDKLIINSHQEFESYLGKELGVSSFHRITQDQITQFADATLDHQWIHTDPQKAAEGPFGTTIAHGYLTISLLPFLWEQIAEFNNIKMMVNYGIEKLKFGQPVKVNDEVRLKAELKKLTNLRGISKTELDVVLEIKGQKKPAFNATIIFLYHFE
ncbi:MAG: MaoC family dehydratase [Bacteroidota bacterium]